MCFFDSTGALAQWASQGKIVYLNDIFDTLGRISVYIILIQILAFFTRDDCGSKYYVRFSSCTIYFLLFESF